VVNLRILRKYYIKKDTIEFNSTFDGKNNNKNLKIHLENNSIVTDSILIKVFKDSVECFNCIEKIIVDGDKQFWDEFPDSNNNCNIPKKLINNTICIYGIGYTFPLIYYRDKSINQIIVYIKSDCSEIDFIYRDHGLKYLLIDKKPLEFILNKNYNY
jgi:hypothetical protein